MITVPSVTISLPGTPVPKGRPRFVFRGHRPHTYTPEKTRAFEEALRLKAHIEMRDRPKFDGAVSVELLAEFPIPESWSKADRAAALRGEKWPHCDTDNLVKVVDAFNGVVWGDDSQVVHVNARKTYAEVPMLTVTVSSFQPKEQP